VRTLSIAGRPARVHIAGTGPSILLLHGIPTSGALWRPVAARLVAEGLRVLVPDLPGWGGSAPLAGPPTSAAHTAWLTALLDALGERAPVVAGHDLGGLLALELLVAGRARAASLTSAWAGLGWMGARITALPILERFFYRRYGGRLYIRRGAAPDRQAAALETFGPGLADPAVVPLMRDIARGLSPSPLARLSAQVRATRSPVRCIWGEDDPFIPPRAARWVARGLGAPLELLPGARHLAPFDRPDAMAAALLRFVRHAHTGRAEGPTPAEP
jgi:2-hydroxymuconate-semialdehyde hydrolase